MTIQTRDSATETGKNVLATVWVFATAAVAFAMFGSAEIVSMTYDLPESDLAETVIAAAEAWHRAMETLGCAGASQWLRDGVAGLRQAPWP